MLPWSRHSSAAVRRGSFQQQDVVRWPVRLVVTAFVIVLVLWIAAPVARGILLLQTSPFRSAPSPPTHLAVTPVRFAASDGVSLRGWFVPASRRAPTIILIPGYKDGRVTMVPYARFLHAAHFNVLLYDPRGTGGSGGSFTAGLREVRDVQGAVRFLARRRDLKNKRVGLLGVSMGAGVDIVAAARLSAVRATIADSAYVNQHALLDGLDSIHVRRITIPLLPLGPWTVEHVLGVPLAGFSPLAAISHIAPRAVMLIHSRHDQNPTTPLSGALRLYRAAQQPKSIWIAPRGGHAGAFSAQPREYARRADAFFRRYLGA
jgi:pimeloyl-ACP methyl ester carboxylesterase